MATGLYALRLRARAIALAALLFYLLPFVLQASLASAAPRDAALEAAVRAGIICSAGMPAETAPRTDENRGAHPGGVCIVCLTGCPLAGAALPPEADAAVQSDLACPEALIASPAAECAFGRPRSDIGARAPPDA